MVDLKKRLKEAGEKIQQIGKGAEGGGGLRAAFRKVGKVLAGGPGGAKAKKDEKDKKIEDTQAVAIPEIPFLKEDNEKKDENLTNVNITYSLIPKNPTKTDFIFSYANIRWAGDRNKPVYHVIEPVIAEEDKKLLTDLKENIRERLDVDFTRLKGDQASSYLNVKIDEALRIMEKKFEQKRMRIIQYFLHRDFVGLGKIEPLMNDTNIEDISCDGINIPIFVAHRDQRFGYIETDITFNDNDELDSFVTKLSQRCGKSISMANPIVDGALPDGSRLQATLSTDIAKRGSNFTIRMFPEKPLTPANLISYGTLDPRLAAYLWLLIDGNSSIMISGGTASGKTSILNAIAMFLRAELKVVSIEDTPEVRISHPNWIQEVAREAISTEGGKQGGKVDLFLLLKESLRQRPDYLIVGEVRGKEAFVLFQQIATGHPGLSTIHADNINSLMDRLTTEPISLPPNLVQSLNAIVFLDKVKYKGAYVRRVNQVLEIKGFDRDKKVPIYNEVFKWNIENDTYVAMSKSYLLGKIRYERGMTENQMKDEVKDRAEVLVWMKTKGIKDYKEFAHIINRYYVDKEALLGNIRKRPSEGRREDTPEEAMRKRDIIENINRKRYV